MTQLTKKNSLRLIILIVCLLLLIAIIASFVLKQSANNKPVNTPLTVSTTPLSFHITPKTIAAYGTTVSPESVTLKAQQTSVITSIRFTPGQRVKKGQLLFTLKIANINNPIQSLEAKVQQAKSWYQREKKMNQQLPNSVSQFALLKAKLDYKKALAAYQEGSSIENINSPINGVISYTNLASGDFVNSGERLVTVVATSPMQVQYQIPSQYADQVQLGQTVSLFPNDQAKAYQGKVIYIAPLLNAANNSLTLRAKLSSNAQLRPNTFGRIVQILNPHYKVLAIPQKFVRTDSEGFYVYTLGKNNKVVKSYFQPGTISQDGLIQVLSGIAMNTAIISSNISQLSSGETVKVRN